MVLVTAFSDTHCLHREIKHIPKSDILIFAGDLTNIGEMGVLNDFNDWLGEQDYSYCIVVAGNHDRCFEQKSLISRKILTNAIYLENSGIELMGLKIWGSPLTSTLPSWSFVETDESKRFEFWKKIPENLDILITHGPPRGIMDGVPRMEPDTKVCETYIDHIGDGMLLSEITIKKPRVSCFGHCHEGYGTVIGDTGTVFRNVAICNAMYNPVNKPQTFNIEPRN